MPQSGLTDEDHARIQTYLEKPRYARQLEDIVPDETSLVRQHRPASFSPRGLPNSCPAGLAAPYIPAGAYK